ncbi:pentraxin fusion protein-like, partial [Pyxicephalus adspersus]|uniref:pentraxin fusion protein-like n=1 Tax=Pyxicephalus adspersus TaxID=30357 RepID=UPI003B5B68D9
MCRLGFESNGNETKKKKYSAAGHNLNIAPNGITSESSNYVAIKDLANRAIDGSTDLDWHNGSCTHTRGDLEPWWKLDMKRRYNVNIVVVSGRTDCCLERLKGAEIRIGDSPDNNNPVCGTILDVSGPTTTFCCNGMRGRYLSIVIPGRTEYLSLCDVKVYVDPTDPVTYLC